MLRKRKRLLAQSTLEYVVLIMMVVFALLASQTFLKRAMQGKLKSSADQIGDQFSPGSSKMTTTTNGSLMTNEVTLGGVTNSIVMSGDTQSRTVNIEIGAYNEEYFAGCGNGRCDPGEAVTCPGDC